MNYQLVSTSDLTGGVDADAEALAHRVNALVAEGYEPVGGPVVRNNPEVGEYFVQAMFKPKPPMVVVSTTSEIKPAEKPVAKKKAPAKKATIKKPVAKKHVGSR